MNHTLNEFMEYADKIYENFIKFGFVLHTSDLEQKVQGLQSSIRHIQIVAQRLADVSNMINKIIINRRKNIQYIDPRPSLQDIGVVCSRDDLYCNKKVLKEVAPGCSLPVTVVDHIGEIPRADLYYIKQTNQFAINVNGFILMGNIGNVTKQNKAPCPNGLKCKYLKKTKSCKFWHTIKQLVFNGIDPHKYDIYPKFSYGSWMHTDHKNLKADKIRLIHSRDTLVEDIQIFAKHSEVDLRGLQLMHDLLIYMVLLNNFKTSDTSEWNIIKSPDNIL